MLETSRTAEEIIQQNPIHVDSKWFKELVKITGSVEATLILSDCMIYHHNKYRSFKVNDQQKYGLLTSIREIQRNYHISYKRAKAVLNSLLNQNLLEIHKQGFIHNQKFYTPTTNALDVIYELQFRHKNNEKTDKTRGEVPLAIAKGTSPYRQKTYKDKNKDKKNNNHNNHNNLLKNYSLLENSKHRNVKTVIFDFKQFDLANIQCEAFILDYFTIKQSAVINTITFCYHDSLDIVKFNQNLNQPDLKKKAKNFRQLVIWAYFEAVKENRNITVENHVAWSNDLTSKIQDNTKPLSENNNPSLAQEKSKSAETPNSSYLLTQSNKLYLIETLSSKGIDDATLILKTAEDIIAEYANLSFNDLLDGIIYRLIKLPEKQRQQKLINQELPMVFESDTESSINTLMIKEETIKQPSKNNQKVISDSHNNALLSAVENEPKNVVDTSETQEKFIEQPSIIDKEAVPDLFNQDNQIFLIEGLKDAGIHDEKLIIDTAREIFTEYPDLNFKDLLEGVMYRLVTLPSKQKKQNKINQSLMAEFRNIADSKALEIADAVVVNQPKSTQADDVSLPQLSDLTMPHANNYVLRQDWANKAEQNFYTGILPDSQKLALVAMIDYVKRKGITITVEQEVYEWLYHMASNQEYYYSRTKNFKHWCNIAMRQLMQCRLHKPAGFDVLRSRIEADSLAVAA